MKLICIISSLLRSVPFAFACIYGATAACTAQEGDLKLAQPLKITREAQWLPDASGYTLGIEDPVYGSLTLTIRIRAVEADGYTLYAQGTDYTVKQPLPPEAQASWILNFKKKQLEPFTPQRIEAYIHFLIQAGYRRHAQAELIAQEISLGETQYKKLASLLLQAQVATGIEQTQQAMSLGNVTEAGRLIAETLLLLESSRLDRSVRELYDLELQAQDLKVRLTRDVGAETDWKLMVANLKTALQDAAQEDAASIERFMLDLEAPLKSVMRSEMLTRLRIDAQTSFNYSQALDMLKEVSFAARYGAFLKRSLAPDLDEFFKAEDAINTYFATTDTAQRERLLDAALSFRGLTDDVFEVLIRRGQRVRPPQPKPGTSPQGPFRLKASGTALEVPCYYRIALPENYHPAVPVPLLIALHETHADAQQELAKWAPGGLQRGWLVAAPELLIGVGKGYLATAEERQLALRMLNDIRTRFAIDPARIYLAGTTMGAYMVWDLALTYPDRFAAAVALGGCVSGSSANYLNNSGSTPLRCIYGAKDAEVDRVNTLVQKELERIGKKVLLERKAEREAEAFLEHIPDALKWLEQYQREPMPVSVDFITGDRETSRVDWLGIVELPKNRKAQQAEKDLEKNFITALRAQGIGHLRGRVTGKNRVELQAENIGTVNVYLSSAMFDLAQPLQIGINGKLPRAYTPDISRKKLLQLSFDRKDRDRLFWGVLQVPVTR